MMERSRKRRAFAFTAASVAALPWAAACSDLFAPEQMQSITELPRSLSAEEVEVLDAGNAFSWRLLRAVIDADPTSNILVSPLSASMALGMTLNGARGATYEQMRDALGYEAVSTDEINAGHRSLLELLVDPDPSLSMRTANSVWYRDRFRVEPAFLDAARTFFDAEVDALHFSDPSAAGRINRWVEEKTD